MFFQTPCSPRLVVLVLTVFTVGIRPSVVAQEVSTSVTDRMEVPENLPAQRLPDEKKQGLRLDAIISAAYDSNIFLSATKPEFDMVYRIGPNIAYSKGDAKTGEGAYIEAAYHPAAVSYADHSSDNRVDHQAAVLAGWRGKSTELSYKGGIQKLGDATVETGRQTDRVEFENEIRLAWMPREKITLEAAGGFRRSDYVDPTLFDSSKTYGEAAIRFAYSPKTRIGMIYQIGKHQVDGANDQLSQRLAGKIEWQPREKIQVSLEAGAEHRKVDAGTQVNPVVEGRVGWTPREGTNLYVTAYQKVESSAFYAGQNYTLKGVTAGVSQRLAGNWSATLEGGLEKSTYSRVSGSAISGRRDRVWFVRPALEYKISDALKVALFYRTSDSASNDPAFGYEQRMAGVELDYQF